MSSAYRNKSESTACFISLTYSRKNKGPNIDPWGTPRSISAIQEYLLWTFTQKLLFQISTSASKVRLKPIYWTIRKSKSRHFLSKMSWFMVSKAFCRSMRIISVNRPESKPVSILSVKYEKEVSVEWFLQNPDWYL